MAGCSESQGPETCCCCRRQVASIVSDSVRPHRRQPTRLPRPWDSPAKNTGVGCHFLLQCMKVKNESELLSHIRLLATPWIAAHQAPPSMGFSRQEYWSGLPLPSPPRNIEKDKRNRSQVEDQETYFETDYILHARIFPGGSVVKNLPANARDTGSIPGLGRSLGEGNGNPLQCSCLENPRDGGAWWAAIYGVARSQTRLK